MKPKLIPATVASNPTTGFWNSNPKLSLNLVHLALTAPSVRIPVTLANRRRLRALRAAELRAWETTTPNAALRAEVRRSLASRQVDAWVLAGVTAITAAALAGAAASQFQFVAHWDRFLSLVRTLIG